MDSIDLKQWGLTDRFFAEAASEASLILGRVTEQHRNLYTVVSAEGLVEAGVSGNYLYHTEASADFPAVGDWVLIERQGGQAVIRRTLARKSAFFRRAAGTGRGAQLVAANIDRVLICMALSEDYNLRRLERYLAIAYDSGAMPLVVLTKADLCGDPAAKAAEVERIAPGVEVVVCSAMADDGYAALLPRIRPGETVAFIGSSGVGKSTLINRLAGEELLATGDVRADGRGRHTTAHRQLIPLPGGAVVIDTPGMRELGAVAADTSRAFGDIEALAAACRFRDCSHTGEPGCAVRAAIEDSSLDAARFANYQKIRAEAGYSGLSSRQIEAEKIERMFGGKGEMKRAMRAAKNKNRGR